jgi:hypothetical protein
MTQIYCVRSECGPSNSSSPCLIDLEIFCQMKFFDLCKDLCRYGRNTQNWQLQGSSTETQYFF